MPVKHKFTMRRPRRRRRRCLSSLLFIPYLKSPLTIRIYLSATRSIIHGSCITHHGSQDQPFLKQLYMALNFGHHAHLIQSLEYVDKISANLADLSE